MANYMTVESRQPTDEDEAYRNLAIEVLALAIQDILQPSQPLYQRSAIQFFRSGNHALWAEYAGYDPEELAQRVLVLVRQE